MSIFKHFQIRSAFSIVSISKTAEQKKKIGEKKRIGKYLFRHAEIYWLTETQGSLDN